MNAHKRESRGFTLIELLVVVAIMAILITLLLPSIKNSMNRARTIECASILREIGQMTLTYVNDHEGRLPGVGIAAKGASFSEHTWVELLNREVPGHRPIQRHGTVRRGRNLYCPTINAPSGYPRAYRYSDAAAGGATWQARDGLPGAFGKMVEGPKTHGVTWRHYRLGAALGLVRRPSRVYLVIEGEGGGDWYSSRWPNNPQPNMGDDPKYPPWSGNSGMYAFRHQGTANFLCMDLHVETVTPEDDVNAAYHQQF